MKRFTKKHTDGTITVPEGELPDALRRLAAFEDAVAELGASNREIPLELSRLKSQGKEKTVRYRELLGQKLLDAQTAQLFERHGISIEAEQDSPSGKDSLP